MTFSGLISPSLPTDQVPSWGSPMASVIAAGSKSPLMAVIATGGASCSANESMSSTFQPTSLRNSSISCAAPYALLVSGRRATTGDGSPLWVGPPEMALT